MRQENILTLDSTLKMPLTNLPIRMTLVKLNNRVVMISPLPKIQSFKSKIKEFGEVSDVVAPNLFHNLGVRPAAECYPKARFWKIKGLENKIKDLDWHNEINPQSWDYQNDLEVHLIRGMPKFNEAVFLHKPSQTLIVTDLCFNLLDAHGIGSRIIYGLFGTYRKFAISRLFLKLVKDKNDFKQSIESLLTLDFDNIIMAHGHPVEGGAKDILANAFRERGVI